MDITIPAPAPVVSSTDPAAPPVTVQPAEQTTPQAEKPAGTPQGASPDGQRADTPAPAETPPQDEEDKKTWKEKRAERNRERWNEFKSAKQYTDQKIANLEAEVHRLRRTGPPDLSQITDPEEAIAERTAWKIQQSQTAERESQLKSEREISAHRHAEAISAKWAATVEDMRERIPDFDQYVTPSTPIHERAAPYLAESEKGGEIAYFLGKNPQVAQDLFVKFQSAPAQAFIELGRIEARLSAPPAKTTSTAPRPAPTLNGGSNPLNFDAGRASTEDMAAQLRKAGLIR